MSILGFLSSSEGKESTYNAGDPVQSLGWEDPLDKGVATPWNSWEFHGKRSLVGYSPWDHKELDMTEQLMTSVSHFHEPHW